VSGTRGRAGVDGHPGACGDLGLGRVSGRRPHAGHQRGHRWSLGQPPRTWHLCGAAGPGPGPLLPQATAVLVPARGRTRPHAGVRRPRCSAVPWPACPPWCPPQPATVSGCGHPDGCSGVRCSRCWRNRGRCPDGAVPRGRCRSLRVSAATGSGRLTGVRWSGAATAARPAGAVGRAARGAARAHRSWPAAPGPGPPRRSAHRSVGP
jgi:hypothetical protein